MSNNLITIEESNKINRHIKENLAIDDIYICPHNDFDNCNCRKPKPGMILEACLDHNIDISKSFMIGDRWKDIKSGQLAGCTKTFFIDYEYKEAVPTGNYITVKSLYDAVSLLDKITYSK